MAKLRLFSPGYEHLENQEILLLQGLIDVVVSGEGKKQEELQRIKAVMDTLYVKYKAAAAMDARYMKDLLACIKNNQLFFDKGGINQGRSAISTLVNDMRRRIIEDGFDDEWPREKK